MKSTREEIEKFAREGVPDLDEFPARIRAVTREQVNAATKALFRRQTAHDHGGRSRQTTRIIEQFRPVWTSSGISILVSCRPA
jgi:predicted Zn-dependent peptidase